MHSMCCAGVWSVATCNTVSECGWSVPGGGVYPLRSPPEVHSVSSSSEEDSLHHSRGAQRCIEGPVHNYADTI